MGTERGLDRLIFFTDAVAAIAITLLILPLVEKVSSTAAHGQSAPEFLAENLGALLSFVLSFAVIARLWVAHHAIFESVRAYNRRLIVLTLIWAFTIVFLPLPTEMISQFDTNATTIGLYIGTMTLSSVALLGALLTIRADDRVQIEKVTSGLVFASVCTTSLFVVALIVGVLLPQVGYLALLVLFLSGPIEAIARRRRAKMIRPSTVPAE